MLVVQSFLLLFLRLDNQPRQPTRPAFLWPAGQDRQLRRIGRLQHCHDDKNDGSTGRGPQVASSSSSSHHPTTVPKQRPPNVFVIDQDTAILNDELVVNPAMDALAEQAALETWKWCADFVVPHNLCPWAAASVRHAADSLFLYLVRHDDDTDDTPPEVLFEHALHLVSHAFQRQLSKETVDPNTAIAFVVQCPKSSSSSEEYDFASFYEWYLAAEDDMLNNEATVLMDEHSGQEEEPLYLADHVTWAPFHPDWKYSQTDHDEDPMPVEKHAPHPTVSIVSTAVIEKAGAAATHQIAQHNAAILGHRTLTEWKRLYRRAVVLGPSEVEEKEEEE